MWGILPSQHLWLKNHRFTPTHVGDMDENGNIRDTDDRFTPTHVGDICCHFFNSKHSFGSPPRMWGICLEYGVNLLLCRFTPTHVGDIELDGVKLDENNGSPPRMWGIFVVGVWNTIVLSVHPHACGGYVCQTLRLCRGRRCTPTHVGDMYCAKSVAINYCGSPPRMWGICGDLSAIAVLIPGSPPRMWGISLLAVRTHGAYRFTPTHVGDIDALPPHTQRRPVHPHACGGYICVDANNQNINGSPPRMWGICIGSCCR